MRRNVLILASLLLAALGMAAQRPVQVRWTSEVESISPTQGIIRWSADINPGWHIYGMEMPEGSGDFAPVPTSITIDPAPGLVLGGGRRPLRRRA